MYSILLSLPILLAVWTQSLLFSAFTLIMLLVAVTAATANTAPTHRQSILCALSSASITVSLYVALGNNSFLGIGTPLRKISAFGLACDIRFAMAILLALFLFATAVVTAFTKPIPILPAIPLRLAQESNSTLWPPFATIVTAFVRIANAILLIIHFFATVIFRLIAIIIAYLYYIAEDITSQLMRLITNIALWWTMARILITFFSIAILAWAAPPTAVRTVAYLRSDGLSQLDNFSVLLACFLAALFSIIVFRAFSMSHAVHNFPKVFTDTANVNEPVYIGAMLVLCWAVAGFLAFIARFFSLLEVSGFDHIGIVTAFSLCFGFVAFVIQVSRITART